MSDDPTGTPTDDPTGTPTAAATGAPPKAASSATARYRVRFDECGSEGSVRPATYLRYAQDLAWIHSAEVGYDRSWYTERGIGWVVRGVTLAVLAPAWSSSELSLTTTVVGYRRVIARRRTDVRDRTGTLLAWTLTDWVLADDEGRPMRIPPEFPARFPSPPVTFAPTKVELPPTPESAAPFRFAARPQEIDPLDHVNNAVYVDWVDEAVAAAGHTGQPDLSTRHYILEYLAPVRAGAPLEARTWEDGDGIAYRLTGEGGTEHLRARVRPGPGDTASETDSQGQAAQ
jgi:acyl-CoA thioester hydrolase